MFSASHDLSIMKWYSPFNYHAKSEREYSQEHSTAMVFHGDPIISMDCNDYCIISGDQSGKLVITAPIKTVDALQFNTKTSFSQPILDISFLNHDFGACYVPVQGVTCVMEKVLHLKNTSEKLVRVRKIPKMNPAFRCDLLKESSLSLGASHK